MISLIVDVLGTRKGILRIFAVGIGYDFVSIRVLHWILMIDWFSARAWGWKHFVTLRRSEI
jgi:hypothetical protein